MPLLHWLSREKDVLATDAVPYRLLESVDDLSYDEKDNPNMLIQGDNLDALKALLPYYAGQVKCIYIDPPYNTKSAFVHYDDNLEHTQWLSMMYPRLELLRELLADDGSIWISIDDSEAHYLKVVMDEIFGRKNFVTTCIWQKRTTRENRKIFSEDHEYLHVYAKNYDSFKKVRNELALTSAVKSRYKNHDNDPRGTWQSVSANAQGGHATQDQFYDLIAPNGKVHKLPKGRCWLYTQKKLEQEIKQHNIWFGSDGNGVPRIKKFFCDITKGLTPPTLWHASDVGTNDQAKKQTILLFDVNTVFDTPKPERLIQRILHIATNPNDLVLDSFLGSGTTAAVAHKMGRRWIGIEMGEHAITHCQPRLKKVVEGEQGGISEAVDWKGGGGFRFYKLGAQIFNASGGINPEIRFEHLAAHIWFCETKTAYTCRKKSSLLGVHDGMAYYLLYNGILGDKTINGGNVLTLPILKSLPAYDGLKVIYGETSRLSHERLKTMNIIFKQTPYDVKAR